KVFKYDGAQADVHWDGRLCIHIGECGHAKNALFVGGRQPWCQPDQVSPDEVADVVGRCPTGALTYERKDGGPEEVADTGNVVSVMYNGPLYVRGDLQVDGAAEDMSGVRFRAALCRCGESKNKPFCDNSHEEAGFKDYGAVGDSGEGFDAPGWTLEVGRAPNGPLLLNGNFTIVAASGRKAWTGKKAALCRCGHSQNKPFCDGAHKDAGFEAE
ncbi:MAG: CDGSH iron-sulfur domain-containing protein, partial [Deltaproteobacteria bacterium]|nr:CDGSH iron-sulfur domain-containing protein [Deltaproteobacteria bacterium]